MAWIAIADAEGGLFRAAGIDEPPGHAAPCDDAGLLARGSLVIETRLTPDGRPQTLLAYERQHPWPFALSFQAIPGGGLAVVIVQGDAVFHTALNHNAHDRADLLRVTYSWDAPRRWGRLAIERPEHDKVVAIELRDPKPLLIEDVRVMASDPRRRHLDPDVVFFAVSDRIEPVGPMPTLTAEVPLLRADGYVPVGHLERGDLVETLESGLVPVLHRVRRTVPSRGSFRPVRLRAPYFGLQRDLVVAPDQRLVVGGSEVEYLFGREAVLVPARHLVNGVSAIGLTTGATVTYHQLVLPAHESVIAAGCPVESLYVGRIRRKPEQLAASLLAPISRALLPEHARSAHLTLKPFEAATLMQRRAA